MIHSLTILLDLTSPFDVRQTSKRCNREEVSPFGLCTGGEPPRDDLSG